MKTSKPRFWIRFVSKPAGVRYVTLPVKHNFHAAWSPVSTRHGNLSKILPPLQSTSVAVAPRYVPCRFGANEPAGFINP